MEEVVLGISMEDDGTSPKKKDRDCDAAGSCGGLDLGFGFGFSYGTTSSHDVDQVISCHREKMIRTEPPFPFRMTNASTTTMASPIFTGAATSASTPLPPLHPSVGLTSPYRNGALYGNPNVFRGMDRTGAVSGAVHLQQDVAARALQMQLQGSLASSPFKSASYSPAPVSVGTSFATAVPPGPATALFTHPLFTPGQWQELQRQALIYKHFMSSAPVPQDLLLDTRSIIHPNAAAAPGGGFLNLRLSGGAVDPEPGRCRRTDGKKWRCSRDAAPDQRYCERHLHRGRPRSRKPVERGRNKTASPAPAAAAVVDGKTNIGSPSVAAAASDLSGGADNGFSGFPFKSSSSGLHHQVSSPYCLTAVPKPELMKLPFLSMLPEKEPRYLDWIKDGGISEIQHHAAPNNTSPSVDIAGFRSTPVVPILQGFPDYRHLNPGTMPDINTSTYPFVNLDQHPPPRRFIDAWSAEGHASGSRDMANCSNPFGATTNASSDQLSPSSLTLSMSGGGSGRSGSGDYVPDHIQMGLAVNELSSNTKSQPMFGPFGGPLAEVLQSGSSMAYPRTYGGSADGGNNASGGFVGATSASYTGLMNLMSRSCSESEGVSPRGDSPPRVLSSPTGVLQRALVSLSDSSSNSSPRFGTGCGGARPEVGLQWMNHNKKWW